MDVPNYVICAENVEHMVRPEVVQEGCSELNVLFWLILHIITSLQLEAPARFFKMATTRSTARTEETQIAQIPAPKARMARLEV